MNLKIGDLVRCSHPNPKLNMSIGKIIDILPPPEVRGHWAGYIIQMDDQKMSNWVMEESELVKID